MTPPVHRWAFFIKGPDGWDELTGISGQLPFTGTLAEAEAECGRLMVRHGAMVCADQIPPPDRVTSGQPEVPMKTYRSHKIVEAGQLDAFVHASVGGEDTEKVAGMYAVLAGGEQVKLPDDFGARGWPAKGDYIVRYQPDGYLSWSPKDKFEDGYTGVEECQDEAEPTEGLSFSAALARLKKGDRVARAGWNGKGMWLALIHPGNAMYNVRGAGLDMQPCIGMKTASPRGEMQPGWLASQADMLANDWQVAA